MAVYGFLGVSERAGSRADWEADRAAVLHYARGRGLAEPEFPERAAAGGAWRTVMLSSFLQERCGPGDTVIVPDVARIARSITYLHQVLVVCRSRGASLHIVRQGLAAAPAAAPDLGALPHHPFSEPVAALYAEFEREIIAAASKEALDARARKFRNKLPGTR